MNNPTTRFACAAILATLTSFAVRGEVDSGAALAREELDYHLKLAGAEIDCTIVEDAALKDEEASVEIKDGKVTIRGGAVNGCVYGVYSFLERELGVRWYDQDSAPYLPRRGTPRLIDKSWTERPALAYRCTYTGGAVRHDDCRDKLFYFRNRINQINGNYENLNEDLKGLFGHECGSILAA